MNPNQDWGNGYIISQVDLFNKAQGDGKKEESPKVAALTPNVMEFLSYMYSIDWLPNEYNMYSNNCKQIGLKIGSIVPKVYLNRT